jgi:hypothetical protein
MSFAIVLSAGGFLMWRFDNNNQDTESYFGISYQSLPSSDVIQVAGQKSATGQAGQKIYKNNTYGFSLKIPESFKISELEDEAGKTILIKNDKYEMQVYASPFDEDIVLTAERIKQDIPDIKMKDVMNVEVGPSTSSGYSKGVAAVTFIDESQNTREVWFVRADNLFQISSRPEDDAITGAIMQLWEWEK